MPGIGFGDQRARLSQEGEAGDVDRDADPEANKSTERDSWSPRAAAAASAFALGLVDRLVRNPIATMPGHPAIPGVQMHSVGADR